MHSMNTGRVRTLILEPFRNSKKYPETFIGLHWKKGLWPPKNFRSQRKLADSNCRTQSQISQLLSLQKLINNELLQNKSLYILQFVYKEF